MTVFERLPDDQGYRTAEVEVLRPAVKRLQAELKATTRERNKLRRQVAALEQQVRDLMAKLAEENRVMP